MINQYQRLLLQLLDKEPLKSTWYYQDTLLAAIEQAAYEAMLFDELFDADDLLWRLGKKGLHPPAEKVGEQLRYMALETREKRLIFRELTLALYDNYQQMLDEPRQAAAILQHGLWAIAREHDETGKIRRFVDEYVYVPKMLLLMIADHAPQIYDAGQREKLSQMKPKFAKYYFNCALEMLVSGEQPSRPADGSFQASALDELLNIDKQIAGEMPHKPKAYGRIK